MKIKRTKSNIEESVCIGLAPYWNNKQKALSYLRGRLDSKDPLHLFLKSLLILRVN